MKTISKLGLMSFALMLIITNAANAQTSLEWKFKDGQKLNYSMEQRMEMELMGQQMGINQVFDVLWAIKSKDKDGKFEMTQTITRIRYQMEGLPTGDIDFDSDSDDEIEGPLGQALTPVFETILNKEISLKMDSKGNITDVKMPAGFGDIANNPGAAQFGFSEDNLKELTGQNSLTFPEGSLEEGKAWNKKNEVKTPFGTMKVDTAYKYESTETKDNNKLAKISVKPKMTIELNDDSPVKIDLKEQDAKGSILFDIAAGFIRESRTQQKMVMEIDFMGNLIEQAVQQDVTMKLVKVN